MPNMDVIHLISPESTIVSLDMNSEISSTPIITSESPSSIYTLPSRGSNDNIDNYGGHDGHDDHDNIKSSTISYSQETGIRNRYSVQNLKKVEILTPISPRVYDFVEEISPLRQGEDEFFKFENFNIIAYFKREMLGIGEPGHLDSDAVEHIQNFLAIPTRLESLLCFGVLICFDAFLFVLTFLPVRAFFSLALLGCEIYSDFYKTKSNKRVSYRKLRNPGNYFHRSNLYDLLRGLLLLFGCISLQWLDMSRVYHFIRGQTMIKLYVLTAMMEMLDKLFASFGQDVFGSLYWQTRTNPQKLSSLFKLFFVACVYVALHSTIYFINVATLAVAVNSSDRALLTVLILNNVSEIKSFVFKKFDKINLFQLSCSDITERFHIGLFLLCISIGGIAQAGPMWFDALKSHIVIFLMFLLAEMISDSVKHAFISKFNNIPATFYEEFLRVLRNDILNSHKDKVILDQTYAITRRVGLSQIPLGCVFIRYFIMAMMSPYWLEQIKLSSWMALLFILGISFIIVLVTKTMVGLGLVLFSGRLHNIDLKERLRKQAIEEQSSSSSSTTLSSSSTVLSSSSATISTSSSSASYTESHPEESLAGIERYTSIEGRVVG